MGYVHITHGKLICLCQTYTAYQFQHSTLCNFIFCFIWTCLYLNLLCKVYDGCLATFVMNRTLNYDVYAGEIHKQCYTVFSPLY